MTICFFGNYLRDYPRNQILINGLKQNGAEVLECHTRERGLKRYWSLFRQHWKVRRNYDFLLVAFCGYSLIWFAKLISSKKIIFDAFVSQYVTNIEDRKIYKRKSIKAKYYKWLDEKSCQFADLVLLDTYAQINYFVSNYNLPKEKFMRIFVGSNNDIFYPRETTKSGDEFIIHFHGYLVPFYGIENIVLAAKILQNYDEKIKINIVTRFNKEYEKIELLVKKLEIKNIIFFKQVPYEKLNDYINTADICLGVFGKNIKANLVIPNKIYETFACAKPLVTAELNVVKELLTNRENVLFCNACDPQDLAKKILELKNDNNLRNKIAENGHKLYLKKLTPKILTKKLYVLLQRHKKTRF